MNAIDYDELSVAELYALQRAAAAELTVWICNERAREAITVALERATTEPPVHSHARLRRASCAPTTPPHRTAAALLASTKEAS